MNRSKVYSVIDSERDYQDALIAGGTYEKAIHTVGEEVLMICHYSDLAKEAWTKNYGDVAALNQVRKIAALCVRCMENHGAIPRITVTTGEGE